MKNSNVLRRFVQGALVFVLLLGFVATFLFEMDAQKPLASAISAPATNASAEQDMRMVMQELERERLDQLNTNPPSEQFSVVRAMDESSIACLEPRPSCDR